MEVYEAVNEWEPYWANPVFLMWRTATVAFPGPSSSRIGESYFGDALSHVLYELEGNAQKGEAFWVELCNEVAQGFHSDWKA
jgi:hypothetical protein